MIANVHCGLSGHFKLEAYNPKTKVTRELADFGNMILNKGLNEIGNTQTGKELINTCQVGSGSSAVAETDTQLGNKIATNTALTSTTNSVNKTVVPYYVQKVKKFEFAPGTIVGNISEVGVGWDTTTGLFSRSLIKDVNGNPTSLTILSDEYLYITYTLKMTIPDTDIPFSIDISGTTYTGVIRPSLIDGWGNYLGYVANTTTYLYFSAFTTAVLGANTGLPSGTESRANTKSRAAYINDSHYIDYNFTFAPNEGVFTNGIGSIRIWNSPFGGQGDWQMSFNPPIMKTNQQTLSLTFRISWGRG